MDSERGSEYIANIALVPPSPPAPQAANLDAHVLYELPQITSPPFPHTPPYNGSYQNSPYSQHSELFPDDIDFNLLSDFSGHGNEYEPSDYDAPEPTGSLLMFETEFMSPHYSPNTNDSDHRSPFDPSSPSSNASINDDTNNGRHSRASSVGSNNHPSPSLPRASHSPQPLFQPSPRLDVTNSFGNMTVHTPDWNTAPLPSHSISPLLNNDVALPKAPRLAMPDHVRDDQNTSIPTINAPDGADGAMDGPQMNIIPATPISGGVPNGRTTFQPSLSRLSQEADSVSNDGRQQQQGPPSQQHSQPPSRNHTPFKFSNNSTPNFVFPDPAPRGRSGSDVWNSNGETSNELTVPPFDYNSQQQQVQRQQQQQQQQQHQFNTFQFGGNSNTNNDFLSPNSIQRSTSDGPRHHRVSRSEDIHLPTSTYNSSMSPNPGYTPHHQTSSSMGGNLLVPSTANEFPRQPSPQFLHPNMMGPQQQPGPQQNRPYSPGRGHFRRASSGTRSDRGAETWGQQGPTAPLGGTRRLSPYPSPNASPRVRYDELEIDPSLEVDNQAQGGYQQQMGPTLGLGLGVSMGGGMGLGGMTMHTEIGDPPVSAGFSEEIGLSGRGTYMSSKNTQALSDAGGSSVHGTTRAESLNGAGSNRGDNPAQPVAKANVTSGRTANASHRRRKQDAHFACNVPGCGSTFTRGFNLKGHLRSHYEQKPYKCHWPGCGKGFARQHDCKRHEQLHSNYRPFECEGCQKQFARMDALNRHLKSDAGKECVVIVERNKAMGVGGPQGMGVGMVGGQGQDMGMLQGGLMVMSEEEYESGLEQEVEERKPRRRNTRSGGGGGGQGDLSNWVTV